MKHPNKTRSAVFSAALLIGLASSGAARTAQASPSYPAALKAALEAHFKKVANVGAAGGAAEVPGPTFCVPLCTACHNTTAGGPGNLNVFGDNLYHKGNLFRGNDAFVAMALDKIFAISPPLDSDGDGKSDELELSQLSSPSLPEPRGVDEFCSDIKYGCGANIAPIPPVLDRVGLFSAAGVALAGLAVFRRSRRRARRSTVR